jgi:hypothetical protein
VDDLLRETLERLLDVTAEHASIAAAFALSYHHLPAARQRFFRLLALHPGTEFDPAAAGALADLPVAAALAELDTLHVDSLLIEVGRHAAAVAVADGLERANAQVDLATVRRLTGD